MTSLFANGYANGKLISQKDALHKWTLQRLNLNSAMAQNLFDNRIIFEDEPIIETVNDFYKLPSSTYYMMNHTDSDATVVEKPVLKFGLPRIGPNGDVVPERFRSLIRPKSLVNGESYSHKFSRSDWDLTNDDKIHRLTSNFCRATADSPGTSMEESVQESPSEFHYAESDIPPLTELADDRSSHAGFFRSRRHHANYFSNSDLFRRLEDGYNYLKYPKASDFPADPVHRNPHIRIIDLNFAHDARSIFDKLMLSAPNYIRILNGLTFELFSGDTLALLSSSELEVQALFHILASEDVPAGLVGCIFEMNGHSLTRQQFGKRIAFVRSEKPPKYLTVSEYLHFYSRFVCPSVRSTSRQQLVRGEEPHAGFFRSRRHHANYFSNSDLFRRLEDGYNYLKYPKASDFPADPVHRNPHIRIIDLNFAHDARSIFDKLMLSAPNYIRILNGLTFELFSGDTLALLSSSELEVQALFHILASEDVPAGLVGCIFEMNGHTLTRQQFGKRIAFVRSEKPPKYLTVSEYLNFYSRFVCPSVRSISRQQLIYQLVQGLALGPLTKRLCGELTRTETQRLLLASKMLLDTDVLICENILREMDLYDAAFVVDFVRDWAQRLGRIVIMAVSPPTMEILTMFRKTAILSAGRFIYFGGSDGMLGYFQGIGYPCPKFKNPCDYYVDLVTHDHLTRESARESSNRIRTLIEIWGHKTPTLSSPQPDSVSAKLHESFGIVKLWVLYRRFWSTLFNRPASVLSELAVALFISLFLGVVFYESPVDRRSGIQDRYGFFLAILVLFQLPLTLIDIHRVYEDQAITEYDRRRDLYSPFIYLISKILFDIPISVFVFAILSLPCYSLVKLNPGLSTDLYAILTFFIVLTLNGWFFRYFGWIFGFLFHRKSLTMLFCMLFFMLILFTNGLVIHPSDFWLVPPTTPKLNPTYWFSALLMEMTFVGRKIFDELLFFGNNIVHNSTILVFGCQQRKVLTSKTFKTFNSTVPIFSITECLKTYGNEIMAFSGFPTLSNSEEWELGLAVIGGGFLTIAVLLGIVVHMRCYRQF
uniref:ABC-2 type transporter transmembrane domain-containing protein n=1 Tax=Acrobeloides nanus TaxID=290746 RepID=A0A914C1U4_9BILA